MSVKEDVEKHVKEMEKEWKIDKLNELYKEIAETSGSDHTEPNPCAELQVFNPPANFYHKPVVWNPVTANEFYTYKLSTPYLSVDVYNSPSTSKPIHAEVAYYTDYVGNPAIFLDEFNGKPAELLKEEQQMVTAVSSAPSEDVLKLVPGSVPEDWHRHNDTGGWVYKTAKVAYNAVIGKDAVIYDKAEIQSKATVLGKAKVFGNATVKIQAKIQDRAKVGGNAVVGSYTVVKGHSKVFGTVGSSCTVSGKTYIREKATVADGTILSKSPVIHRTQKAKGVSVLQLNGFTVPENDVYKIERLKTETQLNNLLNRFVRPCPMTPRHGFVDSRPVNSLEEAKKVVSETKIADKQAEIIAMLFIKATHSGIWTDGQLSIGTGNDGATAGRDTYVIPIQGRPEGHIRDWDKLLKAAGITQAPYLELLWEKGEAYDYIKKDFKHNTVCVQLRDGPKLPNSVDFIPNKMVVKHVVRADGDLLAWESKVKEFKPGTVVYHPGGSLASHYAVHAYLSNIPVIISHEPYVWEQLEPNTETPKPNLDTIRQGFLLGTSLKYDYRTIAFIMLVGCHSTTDWMGRNDLLLGMSMGACYRLIITASLGEFRHKGRCVDHNGTDTPSRESIYQDVWCKILESDVIQTFKDALKSFDKDNWVGAMGGANWFILSRWAALINNALVDGDIKAALEYLNKGVNSVHNGGWTFDKFIDQAQMNYTAKHPVYALLKVAPIFYDTVKTAKPEEWKLEKIPLKDIDPEKYLAEKQKKKAVYAYSATKSNVKLCCSNDCCGNPECVDCHPAVPEVGNVEIKNSCPYGAENKGIPDEHGGKTVWVEGGSVTKHWLLAVCENHLPWYMNPTDNGKLIPDIKYEKVKLWSQTCHADSTYGPHDGKEKLVQNVYTKVVFPICKAHLNTWLEAGFKLYKEPSGSLSGQPIEIVEEIPEAIVLDPTIIKDDYPCGGYYYDENDHGTCGEHECKNCFPKGCQCSSKECHDCGGEHCDYCIPSHDLMHCYECGYASPEGKCTDVECLKCYPESEDYTEDFTLEV